MALVSPLDLNALNLAGPAIIADVHQDGRELRRAIRHGELPGHLGQEFRDGILLTDPDHRIPRSPSSPHP